MPMPKSCKKKKRPRGAYSTLHTHSTQTHTHTREKSVFIVVFSTLLLTIFKERRKNRRIAEPAGSGEPNRSLSLSPFLHESEVRSDWLGTQSLSVRRRELVLCCVSLGLLVT